MTRNLSTTQQRPAKLLMNTKLARYLLAALSTALVMAGCASTPAVLTAYDTAGGDAAIAERADMTYAQESMENPLAVDSMDRMMIGTANLDLVVDSTPDTVASIQALMAEVGGYVSDNNFYTTHIGDDSTLAGTITLRVPSERLQEVLTDLAALAVKVNSQSLNLDDVTDQYTDLDAQLRNLQATETELLALMQEVRERPGATTEDILTVHRSLMSMRGEIEQIQGHQRMLDNLVSMSTINVNLQPDFSALPIVQEPWRPGVAANDALRMLVTSLQQLGSLAIWLGLYAAPLLLTIFLPIGLFLWGAIWLLRKARRRTAQVDVSGQV